MLLMVERSLPAIALPFVSRPLTHSPARYTNANSDTNANKYKVVNIYRYEYTY